MSGMLQRSCAALVLASGAAAAVWCAASGEAQAAPQQQQQSQTSADGLPTTIRLTGVVRDFRDHQVAAGHPDFNIVPASGRGLYANIVQDQLDANGKPVFRSVGQKVQTQWRDALGRNIISPRPYITPMPGDEAGSYVANSSGAVQSAASFAPWYVDTLNVNMSGPLTITLNRQPGTDVYVFDDQLDTQFVELEGFYNPNGQFPNAQGGNKNWSFTYEVATDFVYREGTGQKFTFAGDDDLWVFVDGKLVIDVGGVHEVVSQTIQLDRLAWLENERSYQLKIFFAERNKPRSRVRIETNLNLRSARLPQVSALHD